MPSSSRPDALQRVRPAGGLLAADQDVVVGLEVEQRRAAGRELGGQLLAQRLEEDPGADVDHGRDRLVDALLVVDQPDHVGDQLGRQVVDHEEAEVLELLGRRAPAGAGHPGDDARARPGGSWRGPPSVLLDLAGRRVDGGGPAASDARPPPTIAVAVRVPMPGHLGDLLDGGSPELLSEPKCLISVLRRTSPSPGTSSSRLSTMVLERRDRWWVIAKRWASSRMRWSR